MSATAGDAAGAAVPSGAVDGPTPTGVRPTDVRPTDVRPTGPAARLGIEPGMLVQQVGHDSDCDDELVTAVTTTTGTELVPEDSDDVVDVVLLWWREGDGDLVDALVDALTPLAASGVVWLLTPKAGRDGHVEPSDISEAAPTAGLSSTKSISAAPEWSGTRLVAPKTARQAKTRR